MFKCLNAFCYDWGRHYFVNVYLWHDLPNPVDDVFSNWNKLRKSFASIVCWRERILATSEFVVSWTNSIHSDEGLTLEMSVL